MRYTKAETRAYFTSKREEVTAVQVEDWSLEIANQLAQMDLWKSSVFHLFLSIPRKKEVDTEPLLTLLQGKDKSVVCPKIKGPGEMKNYLLTDQTKMVIHPWGVPEPEGGIEIPSTTIDVVFVPLLGFDQQGQRVGYGGGYYDRFLARCRPNVITIGLSFFDPIAEIHPVEKTDIPLNFVVTPTQIWTF